MVRRKVLVGLTIRALSTPITIAQTLVAKTAQSFEIISQHSCGCCILTPTVVSDSELWDIVMRPIIGLDGSRHESLNRPCEALGAKDETMEQTAERNDGSWDLEADVVIIGSGAAGLPAAIKAAEGGASVIVVETNYDVGGHAIISGGHMALGGGTSAQKKYGIPDSPDTVFSDLTDWSIVQPNGWPDYRYNDRAVIRAFADHCALTYEFLLANGVDLRMYRRTIMGPPQRAIPRPGRIMLSGRRAPDWKVPTPPTARP